jgi:PBSX family phage terminase large subunit
MIFTFTTKQTEIYDDLARNSFKHICIYGGGRSGKTTFHLYNLFLRACSEPNSRHLIVRQVKNSIKPSIIEGSIPKLLIYDDFKPLRSNKDFKINHQDLTVSFPNGSKIYCYGLNDDSKMEHILGNEYSTIFFNECSSINYSRMKPVKSRLAEKNNLVKRFFYDFNPPPKTHWTYQYFIEGKDPETGSVLDNRDAFFVSKLNPIDNLDNIDEGYIDEQRAGGENHYKRFVEGEFSEGIEGVLFTNNMLLKAKDHDLNGIERDYLRGMLSKVVIGVDPAVTSGPESDFTGIVVVGKKGNEYVILEDATGKYTPNQWARKVAVLYERWRANSVIAETNNGGELVITNLRSTGVNLHIVKVIAKDNKRLRAEPIANLYEQGLVKHIEYFKDEERTNHLQLLESQMLSFDGARGRESPDRVDAKVYAIQNLSKSISIDGGFLRAAI